MVQKTINPFIYPELFSHLIVHILSSGLSWLHIFLLSHIFTTLFKIISKPKSKSFSLLAISSLQHIVILSLIQFNIFSNATSTIFSYIHQHHLSTNKSNIITHRSFTNALERFTMKSIFKRISPHKTASSSHTSF